ncbi:ribbon-helix-helix protein, CopG family [Vibrio sp. 10N.222.54.B12]|uniref:ribbon-helix-helix domain-containing protein n=1 Tax=unclassified Vibrio TaxID=2614977 RepID=UPI0035546822
MSKPRITIRFDEEVYAEIQKLAEEQDRSINWLVNNLLQQALKKNSDEISLINPSN